MIFGINTSRDISKLSQISLEPLKYHSWYLCQISLLIMLLRIQIKPHITVIRIGWKDEKYINMTHGDQLAHQRHEIF